LKLWVRVRVLHWLTYIKNKCWFEKYILKKFWRFIEFERTMVTIYNCSWEYAINLWYIGTMSYLRYLCLFNIVMSNIYCVVLLFCLSSSCVRLGCQFLWIVHFWLPLRYSLTFICNRDASSFIWWNLSPITKIPDNRKGFHIRINCNMLGERNISSVYINTSLARKDSDVSYQGKTNSGIPLREFRPLKLLGTNKI
jgi:hypothetical protein